MAAEGTTAKAAAVVTVSSPSGAEVSVRVPEPVVVPSDVPVSVEATPDAVVPRDSDRGSSVRGITVSVTCSEVCTG